jgi:hypothetical protein
MRGITHRRQAEAVVMRQKSKQRAAIAKRYVRDRYRYPAFNIHFHDGGG